MRTGELEEELRQSAAALQSALGISDADLEAFESLQTPELEPRYWRGQMAEVPSTDDMDDLLSQALAALEARVDQQWLESQRAYDYRFDETARTCPLELVGARRLSNRQRP